ncbi:MAG TPA: endonuclease III [Kiloniellaceae bacterium]
MKKADIATFFDRLAAVLPEPKGELEYVNAYTLLVAVVLSAQATDVGVNKATRALFRKVTTPQQMLALGEAGLKEHIRTIGLYNAKARNVIALSQMLVAEHGGAVPRDRDSLELLPGVGRKTANVVLNIAFGEPTIAVDTHIFRVGNRTGLARGKTPLEVERKLEQVVPPARKLHAHHWLILHGRYVCKARRPDCFACVVNDLCAFKAKTTLELPPRKPAKQPPKKTAGGRVLGKQAKAAKAALRKPS